MDIFGGENISRVKKKDANLVKKDTWLHIECIGLAKEINRKMKTGKGFYESSLAGIIFGFVKKKLEEERDKG